MHTWQGGVPSKEEKGDWRKREGVQNGKTETS